LGGYFFEDSLLGLQALPNELYGAVCLYVLEHNFPELLDSIPLDTRQNIWFMLDGTSGHFSCVAINYLEIVYAERWIGRQGPIFCPNRSPDLNPHEFPFEEM
jgi:hypothetical protein